MTDKTKRDVPADTTLLGDEQVPIEQKREQYGQVHGVTHPVEPTGDVVDIDTAAHRQIEGRPAIKVRATRLGYYGDIRRRTGDVFTIYGEESFSTKWMEKVDGRTPERVTTGRQDLQRQHDENLGRKPTGDATVLK